MKELDQKEIMNLNGGRVETIYDPGPPKPRKQNRKLKLASQVTSVNSMKRYNYLDPTSMIEKNHLKPLIT